MSEELKAYILRRVERRTGEKITWEQLLEAPFGYGGDATVTDLLESGLVPPGELPGGRKI